jgi:hypothetical protein
MAVVALLCVGCSPERGNLESTSAAVAPPAPAQQVDIYAGVIGDAMVRSQAQSRLESGRRLYLVDSTGIALGDPSLDRHQPPKSETLSTEVQAGLENALEIHGAEIIWVKSFDEATDETTGLVPDGVVVAVGEITLVSSNQARVPVTVYQGSLAADGWTSVLKRTDGSWAVTGTTGTEWTS